MALLLEFEPARARSPLAHVFMVGAGFSKAIGDAMPTLDVLGGRIAARLADRPVVGELRQTVQDALKKGLIPGRDLEGWLSSLASPAPFVTDIEAHFNAGVFAQVARDMGDEIDADETKVLGHETPPWLVRLVQLWNTTGATVVTFNYDTLIEHVASQPIWAAYHKWPNVAFKLRKLHGSTNWWRFRGTDPQGRVAEQSLLPGWGVPDGDRRPPGDERVLVPPISAKGSFYDLTAIRLEWQQARLALEGATRLFILGYRLPATDLASTTLIGQHLAIDAGIVLVNRDPKEPLAALEKMTRHLDQTIDGEHSIDGRFLETYEAIVGQEVRPAVAKQLDVIPWDLPLMARVGKTRSDRAVVATKDERNRLVLIPSVSDKYGEDRDGAIKSRDLAERFQAMVDAGGAVVIRSEGTDYPVLAVSEENYGARWAAVEA